MPLPPIPALPYNNGLDIMKGHEWIWAVQEVNCIGFTLLNLFRFVWPHLTQWAPQSLLVGPSGSTARGQKAPLGIFACLYTMRHSIFLFFSFFAISCWRFGWHNKKVQGKWSHVDEKDPNKHFPFLQLPIRRHPRWQGSWICRVWPADVYDTTVV